MLKKARVILAFLISTQLVGFANLGVQKWERDLLAKE